MPQLVLDPLDAIHLAFAFEIVPQKNKLNDLESIAAPGLQALASAADLASKTNPQERRLFILYINPEDYRWVKPGAAGVQPAQGVVFSDDTGNATQMLQITGRFGAKKRVAHNRYGEQDVLSGREQFQELEAFIDHYQDLRRSGVNVEFRFHAFGYADHFAVILPQLEFIKNRQTRIGSPMYRLSMQAFRRLDLADIPVSLFDTGLFGMISDAVGFVTDLVDTATVAMARMAASASIPRRIIAQLNPLLSSTELLLDEVARFFSEASMFVHVRFGEFDRIARLWEDLGNTFEGELHSSSQDGTARETQESYRDLRTVQLSLETLAGASSAITDRGTRAERWGRQVAIDSYVSDAAASTLADRVSPDGSVTDGAGTLKSFMGRRLRRGNLGTQYGLSELQFESILVRMNQYQGWVPYVLSDGETPLSVASTQYKDPGRWVDIVLANDLLPPFFGPGPNAAGVGDIIRLPVFGAGPSIPFDVSREALPELNIEIERRIFGVDFLLQDVGDYRSGGGGVPRWERVLDTVVDPGSNFTDWSIVEGFDCFVQRIDKIVLLTEEGELLLFPEFGIPYRIGDVNRPDQQVLLMLNLRQAILSESAVREVKNESIVVEGTATYVDLDIDTHTAGPIKIRRALS